MAQQNLVPEPLKVRRKRAGTGETFTSLIDLYGRKGADKPLPPTPRVIPRVFTAKSISRQASPASSPVTSDGASSAKSSSPLTPVYSKFMTRGDIAAAKRISHRMNGDNSHGSAFKDTDQSPCPTLSSTGSSYDSQQKRSNVVPFTVWQPPTYEMPGESKSIRSLDSPLRSESGANSEDQVLHVHEHEPALSQRSTPSRSATDPSTTHNKAKPSSPRSHRVRFPPRNDSISSATGSEKGLIGSPNTLALRSEPTLPRIDVPLDHAHSTGSLQPQTDFDTSSRASQQASEPEVDEWDIRMQRWSSISSDSESDHIPMKSTEARQALRDIINPSNLSESTAKAGAKSTHRPRPARITKSPNKKPVPKEVKFPAIPLTDYQKYGPKAWEMNKTDQEIKKPSWLRLLAPKSKQESAPAARARKAMAAFNFGTSRDNLDHVLPVSSETAETPTLKQATAEPEEESRGRTLTRRTSSRKQRVLRPKSSFYSSSSPSPRPASCATEDQGSPRGHKAAFPTTRTLQHSPSRSRSPSSRHSSNRHVRFSGSPASSIVASADASRRKRQRGASKNTVDPPDRTNSEDGEDEDDEGRERERGRSRIRVTQMVDEDAKGYSKAVHKEKRGGSVTASFRLGTSVKDLERRRQKLKERIVVVPGAKNSLAFGSS